MESTAESHNPPDTNKASCHQFDSRPAPLDTNPLATSIQNLECNENLESGNSLVQNFHNEQKQTGILSLPESSMHCPLFHALGISTLAIDFGDVMPGQILEETLILTNKLTDAKIPFHIKIQCLSREFDELEEYVYSMRRPTANDIYNYTDTFSILLLQEAMCYFKIAMKAPMVCSQTDIIGCIQISNSELGESLIVIPVKSKVRIPRLKCDKMIPLRSLDMSVIRLLMKNPKRSDFRISLKNLGVENLIADFSILKNPDCGFIDYTCVPPQSLIQNKQTANFTLSVRCLLEKVPESLAEARSVLVAKIRNSSVFFAFPVVILMMKEKST
jgi:hypothetical protein